MLRISPDLELPLDAATRRMAILAMSGAGKSNAAVVLAEEMYREEIPWVAIDPKGDWWGLRSSRDGLAPGLQVPIFGGLHGDIPLEPRAGKVLADLIVDQRVTCVLDVSEFDSNQQMWTFLADFGDRLYARKAAERWPLHLFLDEADQYMPQSTREGGALPRCLGVWVRVQTKGRSRGIGSTLISQRSATVHKDALYMAEALFAMRTVGPRNRGDRPVIAGWFDANAFDGRAVIDLLPELGDGEAIAASPVWLAFGQRRIKFNRRATFDSGSTPTVEEANAPIARLADIDLRGLSDRMAETIERAKADDPSALRAEIAGLRRELGDATANGRRVGSAAAADGYAVELGRVTADRDDLRRIVDDYGRLFGNTLGMLDDIASGVSETAADVRASLAGIDPLHAIKALTDSLDKGDLGAMRDSLVDMGMVQAAEANPARTTSTPSGLKAGARRILANVAAFPRTGLTRDQAGTLAAVRKGGTFSQYVNSLKAANLIVEGDGRLYSTPEGRALAGSVPIPRTSEDVVALYTPRLKAGARRMLDVVLALPRGHSISRSELSERAGIEKGGTLSQYVNSLIRPGLVDVTAGEIRAGATLYIFEQER